MHLGCCEAKLPNLKSKQLLGYLLVDLFQCRFFSNLGVYSQNLELCFQNFFLEFVFTQKKNYLKFFLRKSQKKILMKLISYFVTKFYNSILKKTLSKCTMDTNQFERGARYLMGENLEVVWAEFSTLS
jgi:hypothetical protein